MASAVSGPPTHGVHVAQGIGRGNLPKRERVVDHGSKEIHGLYECTIVANAVDTRIVRLVESNQKIGVRLGRKAVQDGAQRARSELTGASAGFYLLSQSHGGTS